jgi:hypothetical protein
MDIEGIEKKRIHGLIRSQRSDGDIKGAGDDRTNSQQFEKMLPLMEPKKMAKHKRCVSFKDQERSMPMLGSFTRKPSATFRLRRSIQKQRDLGRSR